MASVALLAPGTIRPSVFANRLAYNWELPASAELRDDIKRQGGNVLPIKVRPVGGETTDAYEIVYGHRRHRACLELGLQVRALAEPVSNRDFCLQMMVENQRRSELTPYEQGRQFKQALDAKVFANHTDLADPVGLDHSAVSKLVKLGTLRK